MTCENCRHLEQRIAVLEMAASHSETQRGIHRIHRLLIAAGLDPCDSEFVSAEFLQGCLHLNSGPALETLIADQAKAQRFIKAKRAHARAESNRITEHLDDEYGADCD